MLCNIERYIDDRTDRTSDRRLWGRLDHREVIRMRDPQIDQMVTNLFATIVRHLVVGASRASPCAK